MSNKDDSPGRSQTSDIEDQDLNEQNIIKVLVASDINLGYEETIKGDQEDDSFRTFEEILIYARDYEVDVVLLGGNLFYETNPPLCVITKCISLLRKYCLSDKPVKIDCLTDPEWIFNHCSHKTVNFADPNLKIGIPIFSIYGHRDSPIFSPLGSLDLLAATGLVNYFGKWHDNPKISIPPLLIRKGISTLALYGLNHMNDGKLSKLMERDKFELLQEDSIPDVCSVLVLHQSRARQRRSEKMFVPESLIPDFLNLVIWGHEPVCRIEHQPVPDKTFRLSQPGSTVATSFTRGESVSKKIAILEIYKDAFKMKYVRLKTVRPFIHDQLNIHEHEREISSFMKYNGPFGRLITRSRTEAIEKFVDSYIENILLPRTREKDTGHPSQPKKPLLRLRLVAHDSDNFQIYKLSKKYMNIVANPHDMILFSTRSLIENDDYDDDDDDDYEELSALCFENETQEWRRTVEGGISEYFNQEENMKKLKVLSLGKLDKALADFKMNDNKAFERTVRGEIQECINTLIREDVPLEDVFEAVQNYDAR